jgi:hypothetical protein
MHHRFARRAMADLNLQWCIYCSSRRWVKLNGAGITELSITTHLYQLYHYDEIS